MVKEQHNKIKTMNKKEDLEMYQKFRYEWSLRSLFLVQTVHFCISNCGFAYIFNYEHLDDEIIKMYKLLEDELEWLQ